MKWRESVSTQRLSPGASEEHCLTLVFTVNSSSTGTIAIEACCLLCCCLSLSVLRNVISGGRFSAASKNPLFQEFWKKESADCETASGCRITAWFGLEGTLKTILFQPPAMSRDTFHQPRLLKALSSLALNLSREGAATASLGTLCQGLTTLIMILNLPSFSLKRLPLVLSLRALVESPSPAFL